MIRIFNYSEVSVKCAGPIYLFLQPTNLSEKRRDVRFLENVSVMIKAARPLRKPLSYPDRRSHINFISKFVFDPSRPSSSTCQGTNSKNPAGAETGQIPRKDNYFKSIELGPRLNAYARR